jgi:hypothetical protein
MEQLKPFSSQTGPVRRYEYDMLQGALQLNNHQLSVAVLDVSYCDNHRLEATQDLHTSTARS